MVSLAVKSWPPSLKPLPLKPAKSVPSVRNGYHLIKVEEKRAAAEPNFEKSKEEIEEYLFNQKLQQEYNPWLQEVSGNYQIETFLNTAS